MEMTIKVDDHKELREVLGQVAICHTTDIEHPSPCVYCGACKHPAMENVEVKGNEIIIKK